MTDPGQSNTVYALGGYGLYRSLDGGVEWSLAGAGLAGSFLFVATGLAGDNEHQYPAHRLAHLSQP